MMLNVSGFFTVICEQKKRFGDIKVKADHALALRIKIK
jgi:hypothetical protein